MKKLQLLFVSIVIAGLLLPFVGTIFAPTQSTGENRTLAEFPSLLNDDGFPNLDFFKGIDSWFNDHFAGRNVAVSANAALHSTVFGTSATDQVILGKDGWLFFSGSLADYYDSTPMSDAALRNIAHNIFLMQGYVQYNNATFVFTIAPNKNSIYPEYMPSNYLQGNLASNAERLKAYLQEYGVNYVDLFKLLQEEKTQIQDDTSDAILYLITDSHWNNRTALTVSNALSSAVGIKKLQEPAAWEQHQIKNGDLASMLYPTLTPAETQYYYPKISSNIPFANANMTTADDMAQTSGNGTGKLLMFRDSFGNTLVPFLGQQTSAAFFKNIIPYDATLTATLDVDYVIVERVERHLYYLAEHAPYSPSPTYALDAVALSKASATDLQDNNSSLFVEKDNDFITVSGNIDQRLLGDGSLNDHSRILVTVSDGNNLLAAFEAFTLSDTANGSDNAYRANIFASFIDTALNDATAGAQTTATSTNLSYNVYVQNEDSLILVKSSLS
ncbi:MAG: hypothetical protein LBG97_10115 [Coriobacteriales bacterium]|jgi:hypothetical protein|nr:hypothetical protein [Coriobacteriales bacterium]